MYYNCKDARIISFKNIFVPFKMYGLLFVSKLYFRQSIKFLSSVTKDVSVKHKREFLLLIRHDCNGTKKQISCCR